MNSAHLLDQLVRSADPGSRSRERSIERITGVESCFEDVAEMVTELVDVIRADSIDIEKVTAPRSDGFVYAVRSAKRHAFLRVRSTIVHC